MAEPSSWVGIKIFVAGANWVRKIVDQLNDTKRHLVKQELDELRKSLKEIQDTAMSASIHAQKAVRMSPNDPEARKAQEEAIWKSTSTGQLFATIFLSTDLQPQPVTLIEARRRFREVVADEANIDVVGDREKEFRCVEIETATADFCARVDAEGFRQFGIGTSRSAGRNKGRRLPG